MDTSNSRVRQVRSHGEQGKGGNILGIEPHMLPQDYKSQGTLCTKLASYLDVARTQGLLNEQTIVLWPEWIGSPILATGEAQFVYTVKSIGIAIGFLIVSHLPSFIRYWMSAAEKNRIVAAVFRMKAQTMAEVYDAVFSSLARDYVVTMVAGSIVLPAPQIRDGKLVAGAGPLYNVSAIYASDGSIFPNLVLKAFPTADELPFTTPAPVQDLPAFDTVAGRLGVLICADSWYPQAYATLKSRGVDFIAVPSFGAGTPDTWNQPWAGYDGWPCPPDVDPNDIGHITEGQAWFKYAMAGRIGESGAGQGVNVFLRGDLWNAEIEGGRATVVNDGKVIVQNPVMGGSLFNLWL
ncbi:MAG: nitrilase-related carbon-nitrogen hydrolase [Chloroflexota bacterium]